ncbi:phospholipase D-like domain-containing protein [Cupriavidus sp. 8B]
MASEEFLAIDGVATIYRKELATRWASAASPSGIHAFSPYLTSGTADEVFSGGAAFVYTLFTPEVFASGASSLPTLRALVEAGHAVFEVADLHAKVMLGQKGFVSIGSQNITNAGTRNRELTAVFMNGDVSNAVLELVDPWMRAATLITAERIDEMEAEVEPLKALFGEAQRLAEAAAARLAARKAEREAAAAKAAEEARRRRSEPTDAELLELLAAAVRTQREAATEVVCTIGHEWSDQLRDFFYTLKAPTDRTLTKWVAGGGVEQLADKQRYLCLREDTGALGWVRLNTGRITFVSRVNAESDSVTWGDYPFDLELCGTWLSEKKRRENLQVIISLRDNYIPEATVRAFFDGQSIRILRIARSRERDSTRAIGDFLVDWIEKNPEQFAKDVVERMTTPYLPMGGNKLSGRNARLFFGHSHEEFELRLIHAEGNPLILAKRYVGPWYTR